MSLSKASVIVTRRSLAIFFLGISSGLPYLLVFGTLSVWLAQAGIDRATIGFLSWAGLSYSFKFVWAPLVDNLSVPFLTRKLGRRRAWILLSQIFIAFSLLWMSRWDPAQNNLNLAFLALGAVMLAFASATQDIAIDAYRIDVATDEQQALLSGLTVSGYRLGMILAGAGMFEIVGFLGVDGNYAASAWGVAYSVMSIAMLTGIVTTLVVSEPESSNLAVPSQHTLRLLAHFVLVAVTFVCMFVLFGELKSFLNLSETHLGAFFFEVMRMVIAIGSGLIAGRFLCSIGLLEQNEFNRVYISPFSEFFGRFGSLAVWLLLVICFYRTSDIVMGVLAKVFYVDIGYSTREIGRITFAFGLAVTLTGGVVGGLLALRYGVIKMLMFGAVTSALSNLLFIGLANQLEPSVSFLTFAIVADNFSGGLAMAVSVAFLSSLTSKKFSATQYAAFISVTLLLPNLIAGYSGSMIEVLGYQWFFAITALMGIPVIGLICVIWKPYNKLINE